MSNKIVIDLSNGLKLVAEQNNDPDYKNEIFVGLMKDDGIWHQDLAIVRNAYSYSDAGKVKWDDENFEVLVFGNENDDYTECFTISTYHEEV